MNKQDPKSFLIEDWRVSPAEGLLARGDEVVHLEPKAMEVLAYFISRPNEVITREELERDVWKGALVGYDAVTNTIIKLRKALQDDARQPRFIATIPKKGYQLIAPISGLEDDAANQFSADVGTPAISKPGTGALVKKPAWSKRGIGIAAAALVSALVLGLWMWPANHNGGSALPSIAVLPFDNLNGDPKQQYLADGLTEDIITDLSRLSSVLVIASDTSSTYKDKAVTPEEIGAELNVTFILKGSTRQIGDKVRVNAQLVNTKTGYNAWALRYDGKTSDVFSVQDEMTKSIVEALAVKITNQEQTRIAQRATDNLKAYDFFQDGQRISTTRTREGYEQAREAYEKAIALDPNYGRAYGAIAVALAFDYLHGWTDTPLETLDRALVLAQKAVTLDDSTPQTYWALGFVHLMRKEYASAEKAVTQSVTIAPNYADGFGLLALIKMYTGQHAQAIEIGTKGMQLNPYFTWQYLYTLGGAYYMRGDYDKAIDLLEQAQARNDNTIQVKVFLTASYVKAGRQADAEWVIDRLEVLSPGTTLSSIDNALPIADIPVKQALLKDLRLAGLRDQD